jgi:hypothetical protein
MYDTSLVFVIETHTGGEETVFLAIRWLELCDRPGRILSLYRSLSWGRCNGGFPLPILLTGNVDLYTAHCRRQAAQKARSFFLKLLCPDLPEMSSFGETTPCTGRVISLVNFPQPVF